MSGACMGDKESLAMFVMIRVNGWLEEGSNGAGLH